MNRRLSPASKVSFPHTSEIAMKPVAWLGLVLTLSLTVAVAGVSPYAGQQGRGIKALSDTEVADLLAGKGMGYAKAAELNGYPGPLHVLELADRLELTTEQRRRSRAIFDAMQSRARDTGARLIEAERELDRLFADRRATPKTLSATTARIGQLQAQLREIHLEAHLTQTQVLTPAQAVAYQRLRGYDRPAANTHQGHSH
jgi:Spy/CpxP family protein refolding chaperone